MKKWRLLLFVGLIIVLLPILMFSFISVNKYILKVDVEKHLTGQGYTINQIESIETFFGKAPLFGARVVFSNEKNVTYYYMRDRKIIRQFGTPTGQDGNEIFNADLLLHAEENRKD